MAKKIGSRRSKPELHPVHNSRIDFLEYYSEEEVRKARQYVMDCFEASKNYRAGRREEWLEYYMAYRAFSPFYEERDTWQSALYIPECYKAIAVKRPRLIDAIFAVPPIFTAVPEKPSETNTAKQWEYYIDTLMWRSKYFMTHYEIETERLMYGTSIPKIEYCNNDDFDGFTGTRVVATDLFDIYPAPHSPDVYKAAFIEHRDVTHIEKIKHRVKTGLYNKKAVDGIKSGDATDYLSVADRERVIGYAAYDSSDKLSKDMHEVIEYWGWWYDEDKDERFDIVMTVVDRKHVIRFEETPYVIGIPNAEGDDYWYAIKPFVQYWDTKVPHEFYGIGEIELIKDMNYAINDSVNLMQDSALLSLAPVYQAQINQILGKDMKKIDFSPGRVIQTLTPNALQPLQRDMGWLNGYEVKGDLKHEIEATTGTYPQIRGEALKRTVKATEHVSLVEEANMMFRECIQMEEFASLWPQAKMIQMLEYQYTDEKTFAIVRGEENVSAFMEVTPSEMKFDGAFRLQVASLYGQKSVMAAKWKDFIDVSLSLQQAGVPVKVDFQKALELWANTIDLKDKSVFQPSPEQQPANPLSGVPEQQTRLQSGSGEMAAAEQQGQAIGAIPDGQEAVLSLIQSKLEEVGAMQPGGPAIRSL